MRKTSTLFFALLLSLSLFSQNKALHFDGTDDYVAIAENTSVLTGSSITVEVWVKPSAFGSFNSIINKGSSGNNFLLRFGSDPEDMPGMPASSPFIHAFMYNGSTNGQVQYNITTAWLNQWHHLAVTYDGSIIKLYVDGAVVASSAFSGNLVANAGYLRIGSSYGNNLVYAGALDELRIWNVVRTQTEIQAAMNKEINPNTAGLVAYYPFNDGLVNGDNTPVSTLTDLATSPRPGTLMNFAKTGTTSNFVAGSPSLVLLPLKENSFVATAKDGSVNLSWKDAGSESPSVFEVERSTNGSDFRKIGSVYGASGLAGHNYSFTDRQPSDVNFYRLKIIDPNNQFSYSPTIVVRLQQSQSALQLYPNPATDLLNLRVNAPKGTVQVQVMDMAGRTLQRFQLTSEGNSMYVPLSIRDLPRGAYSVVANQAFAQFVKE
jgi:hypothetical protein